MKAKYYKKLRSIGRWYDVDISTGLFGSFPYDCVAQKVFARSGQEACRRAQKRGYGLVKCYKTSKMWGCFRVKLSEDPPHFSCFIYY
jgi:hypothetical protein